MARQDWSLASAPDGQRGGSLRICSDRVPRATPIAAAVLKVVTLSSRPLVPFCKTSMWRTPRSFLQLYTSERDYGGVRLYCLTNSAQVGSSDGPVTLWKPSLSCSSESSPSAVPEHNPATKKKNVPLFCLPHSPLLFSLLGQGLRTLVFQAGTELTTQPSPAWYLTHGNPPASLMLGWQAGATTQDPSVFLGVIFWSGLQHCLWGFS